MCGNDGRFQRTGYCVSDEWCTGAINETDSVYENNIDELCRKGKFEKV